MNIPEGDAEDVAIDVFMKVHGNIGTFRHGDPAKLTTWIFQIAKNQATDCHRSSKAEAVQEAFDDHVARHSQPREGAYAGRNTELLKWLNKELAKLPEQDQSLLKWRALEIPYAQIGQWLGISEGAARKRT
jgi:RNA polymerase sigma factor (sigma-70 family)